jgi:hypothetical protein
MGSSNQIKKNNNRILYTIITSFNSTETYEEMYLKRDNLSSLPGVNMDLINIFRFFTKYKKNYKCHGPVALSADFIAQIDKDSFKEGLRENLFNREGQGTLIFYSGHCNEEGSWILSTKKANFLFSFQEMVELWDSRKNIGNRHLLIIIDACHSGIWVEECHKLSRTDISIQASCLRDQLSADTNDEKNFKGGTLISSFLSVNKGEKLKVSEIMKNQTPNSYGCPFTARNLFEIEILFNNYEEMNWRTRLDPPVYDCEGRIMWEGQNNKNKKPHGIGTLYDEYGYKLYDGFWKNGHKEGKGVLFHKNMNIIKYCGNWKNNMKNGKGIEYDDKGNKIFEGSFLNDKYFGLGIKYYANGNVKYDGFFRDGKRNGNGIEFDVDGKLKFSGFWVDDLYMRKRSNAMMKKKVETF